MSKPAGIFKRRYLTGLDWVIGTLDHGMKKRTGAGNASQLMLVLTGRLDAARIERGIREFASVFPMINGCIRRDWLNLAPYWEYDHGGEGAVSFERMNIPQSIVDTTTGSGLSAAMIGRAAEVVNRPFATETEHLRFALFSGAGDVHALCMTFDHKLMDARGAETFLSLALDYMAGKGGAKDEEVDLDDLARRVPSHISAGLTGWTEKFLAGRDVNRSLLAVTGSDPALLRQPQEFMAVPTKYLLHSFSEAETEKIYAHAQERAGFLMEMPYMLGAVSGAMEGLLVGRRVKGRSRVAALTTDTRQDRDKVVEMFFNYSSFMFFVLPEDDAADMGRVMEGIKQQMYEQVKDAIPKKLAQAAMLMRIAPFGLIDRIVEKFLGAGSSTYSFSYVGKSPVRQVAVEGAAITNMFHMPRVPAPPGIGVFFNLHGKRLNATVSWVDGIITMDEASALMQGVRRALLA